MEEKRDILRIAKGNDFTLLVMLSQKMAEQGELANGDISDTTTGVIIVTANGSRICVPQTSTGMDAHDLQWNIATTDDGKAVAITIPCTSQQLGPYGLIITGNNGSHWRYKAKPGEAFEIVDATSEQHFPDDQVRVFALSAFVGIGAGIGGSIEQVQSDWNEADETSPAFIQNKPNIPSLDGYATINYVNSYVNSSLTGYVTAGYVNSYVSNQLSNYATQQWVNNQNFLKEHQSLDGYATQQWVNEQNFLKQHQDISGKEDKMQIVSYAQSATAITVEFGYNKIGFEVNTLAITLPTVGTDVATLKGLLIKFTTGTNPNISFTNNNVIFADAYDTPASSIVELNAIYDGDNWYITSQKFNTQN